MAVTAPLIYLDQNEVYLPSDIQAQLNNTYPALNSTAIKTGSSPLLLTNLDQLSVTGSCNINSVDACPIYLTSKVDITTNPPWLYGVLPDPTTHETVGAQSCAIIVNEHESGVVDAFYMYFYAFNLGNMVLGQTLGNHVGDWEYTMVRFKDGKPIAMWLSQHDVSPPLTPPGESACQHIPIYPQSGQAFAYDAVSKNGTRPIIYSAIGTHANYVVPGTHSRFIASIAINDTTSAGPLWDPIRSAYYYTYKPSSPTNGTFTGPSSSTPVSWLYFLGRWGDERYADSDPRQTNLMNLGVAWKYDSGPTGPLDKNLNRTEVCPGSGNACATLSVLPAVSGPSVPVTVSRSATTTAATKVSASPSTPASGRASGAGGSRSLGAGLGIAWMAAAML